MVLAEFFHFLGNALEGNIECISQCVITNNLQDFIIVNAAALAIAFILLLIFRKKISLKKSLFLKIAGLMAFLFILGAVFFSMNQHFIFRNTGLTIVFLFAVFYLISFFLSNWLTKLSLKKASEKKARKFRQLKEFIDKEAVRLGFKAPELLVFESNDRNAFVVSGFTKTIFMSTALVESFSLKELKAVLMHELYHLKGHFFSAKRILFSVKQAFLNIIPVHFDELDDIEEMAIDSKLKERGFKIDKVKEKL